MKSEATCWLTTVICSMFVELIHVVTINATTTMFQCPQGHYLSTFNTAFFGTERYYKFACSAFENIYMIMNETCNLSDSTPINLNGLYLSCRDDQYTSGIVIVENNSKTFSTWQLFCCTSKSAKIRTNDCSDSHFVNENRQSATFSTGAQIIRSWQAMLHDNDLRWWLQLCPVDISSQQLISGQWAHRRFNDASTDHVFIRQDQLENVRSRFFNNMNRVKTFPKSTMRKNEQRSIQNSENQVSNRNLKTALGTEKTSFYLTYTATTAPTSSSYTKSTIFTTMKEDAAIDYYDTYDESFDKSTHVSKLGILGGVSDLLQNIQDGLSIAQAALPSDKKQIYTATITTTTTTDAPAFLLSRDGDSLTVGVKHNNEIGTSKSVLKLKRYGPNPTRPNVLESRTTSFKLGDPNALQQMFQFFGLCKGHEL